MEQGEGEVERETMTSRRRGQERPSIIQEWNEKYAKECMERGDRDRRGPGRCPTNWN